MYFVGYFMKKHSVTITEDDKSNSACSSAALKIPVKIETQRKWKNLHCVVSLWKHSKE